MTRPTSARPAAGRLDTNEGVCATKVGMANTFRRADRLSTWRRIALHIWRAPADPTVYGNLEIDMREALEYLETVNTRDRRAPATVTHMVVKAIATALRDFPDSNAIVSGNSIYLRDSADVYCQVSMGGGRDLTGVKIPAADTKSVAEIAEEMDGRVKNVHGGRDKGSEQSKRVVSQVPHRVLGWVLKVAEYLTYDLRLDLSRFGLAYDQFGGAMVSNVGMFGIGHGLAPLVPVSRTPIVLLVGEVKDKPIVDNGELSIGPQMTIGCTFDHRVIDGHQAGLMAKTVIECLEKPFTRFGLPSRSSSTGDRFVMDRREPSNRDPIGTDNTGRRSGSDQETGRRLPEQRR